MGVCCNSCKLNHDKSNTISAEVNSTRPKFQSSISSPAFHRNVVVNQNSQFGIIKAQSPVDTRRYIFTE